MKKILWMLMGMLVVIGALALAWFSMSDAYAKKDGCPDDQTCTWAIKYNNDGTEKFRQCMPIQADLGEGMVRTGEECGKKKENKATATKEVKITYTPKPDPTKTPFAPKATKVRPNPTRRPYQDPTPTIQYAVTPVTPYVLTVTNMDDCPVDCVCLLVTQAVIQNELDAERNRLMIIQNDILLRGLYLQQTVTAP